MIRRIYTRRSAFSLVELMIVIAVIVILIALLLPAVGMARAKARQSQCASNINQLYLAWTQASTKLSPTFATAQWQQKLASYVGDQSKVFNCPDNTSTGSVSYAMNSRAFRMGAEDFGRIVLLDYNNTLEAKVVGQKVEQLRIDWPANAAPRHFQQLNIAGGGGQSMSKTPDSVDPQYCEYYLKYWRPKRDSTYILANCLLPGQTPPASTAGTAGSSSSATASGGTGTTAASSTAGTSTGATTTGSTSSSATASGTSSSTSTTAGTTTTSSTSTSTSTTTGTTSTSSTTGSQQSDPPPDCGNANSPIVQGLTADYATYYYVAGQPIQNGQGAYFKDIYTSGNLESYLTHFSKSVRSGTIEQLQDPPVSRADWGGHQYVSFCGQIKGPITGTVYFRAAWDDSIELIIGNDKLVFDTVTSNWSAGWPPDASHIVTGNLGSFIQNPPSGPGHFAPVDTSIGPFFKFDFVKDRWYDFQLMACNSNAGSYYMKLQWYTLDGQLPQAAVPATAFRTNQN